MNEQRQLTPDIWERVRPLVDRETGIVTQVFEATRSTADAFGLFYCIARHTHVEYHLGRNVRSGTGGGMGLTRQEALGKAIGEALEGYCLLMHWGASELIRAPLHQIHAQALDPRQMCLVSTEEHTGLKAPHNLVVPFDPDTPLLWIWGTALSTKRPLLLPASMVNLPATSDEPWLWEPNTSGLACGSSIEAATLSALLEIVERDGFLIAWWNQLPCPRLPNHIITSDTQLARLLEHLTRRGLELVVNDITMETNIPAYCAWLVNRSGRLPAATLGAAAHLDPRIALRKAILEACHTYWHCHTFLATRGEQQTDFASDYQDVVTFDDHVLLYSRPDMLRELEFMLQAPLQDQPIQASLATGDPETDLQTCLQRLVAAGMEAYVVDLTMPEVAACGFHVVRVLVSGTQQLAALGRLRLLDNPRLYRVPRLLGYSERDSHPNELNRLPHPFP